MNFVGAIISLIITAVSLIIVSKLPTGVEIDNFQKALVSAAVFGILNFIANLVLYNPLSKIIVIPLQFVSFGLFNFIVNVFIFGLAAFLVKGFRLRWGIMSVFIGSLALSVVNSIIHHIVPV
ncbi:putative membrane protein [Xenococcus sp. PCC 7305]|uniref:phage holin family protein n=1 Tax=Xenococcus sp. PCC 7305 TaxID=102125 RepID=UPI0002ABA47A|nr:phage holin family protein [Xenococcus sp. PCC 7305]ELS01906.1 putative membrane protein [Xenococcus sp. PCC 7305]